jgi:hypothetical protein
MLQNQVLINSPVRSIKAKAELYEGSALVTTYSYDDDLISIDIERVGEEGKFFGFGISQKVNIKLRDINREKNITTANYFKIYFASADGEYISNFPRFNVTEVHRDENTNQLSITAYDALYKASNTDTTELINDTAELVEILEGEPYGLIDVVGACASIIGCGCETESLPRFNIPEEEFNIWFYDVLNLEGTEKIREVLNAAAEITQTVYYIDPEEYIMFKRMDRDGEPVLTISKSDYITLDSKTNRKLTTITKTTQLGDEVTVTTGQVGTTQFIRDNQLLELRDDIDVILDRAIEKVGNFTINQFNCNWRGNYLLEIGDKIALVTKDNETVYSYVINDVMNYNGGFSETTSWNYLENENETSSNPTSLGETLKQTYAKVDKANKQINLVASETSANSDAISTLQLNVGSMTSSVSKAVKDTEDLKEDVTALSTTLTQTAEDLKVSIKNNTKEEINEEGIKRVTTETGFTFNEEGLTVSKTGSNLSTTVSEDGLQIKRNDTPVLVANNNGVDAMNLHATTYLFVGKNSRFEDYANGTRTGCFWIGG